MRSALKKQSTEKNTITTITSVKVTSVKVRRTDSGTVAYGVKSVMRYKDVTAICAAVAFV